MTMSCFGVVTRSARAAQPPPSRKSVTCEGSHFPATIPVVKMLTRSGRGKVLLQPPSQKSVTGEGSHFAKTIQVVKMLESVALEEAQQLERERVELVEVKRAEARRLARKESCNEANVRYRARKKVVKDQFDEQVQLCLHSTELVWTPEFRYEAEKFRKFVRKTVNHIMLNCLEDTLKAPLNNPPNSNFLVPSAVDIYFGKDLATYPDGTVERFAYGTAAGTKSIGLNPMQVKVRPMTTEITGMCELVSELLYRHYRKALVCGPVIDCGVNCFVNKVYSVVGVTRLNPKTHEYGVRFVHKIVGTHCDMELDPQHRRPAKHNSQKWMTPVLLVTFGDTKYLDFEQWETYVDAKGNVKKRKSPMGYSRTFVQKLFTMILLDPRDEYADGVLNRWWQHSSEMAYAKGACITLIFRVAHATKHVYPNGLAVAPTILTGKKGKQFAKMGKAIEKGSLPRYERDVQNAKEHMQKMLLGRVGGRGKGSIKFDQWHQFKEGWKGDDDEAGTLRKLKPRERSNPSKQLPAVDAYM